MDTTENKKDIIEFKQAMEIIPSAENGWELVFDDPVNKKYPDSHLKIYKKKIEGDDTITTIEEGTLTNIAADKWFQLMTDIPTILKGDTPLKEIKCIEKFSNNHDVIYMEMNLPFPMSNRDLLQKRLFLGNKEDPALVKELGLYDWSHRYYVISWKSVERADVPVKKDIVRGTTKMNYCLIEEDPQAWNKIKIRQVACQEMGGSIPKSVLNNFGAKGAQKRFETMLENYTKCFSS